MKTTVLPFWVIVFLALAHVSWAGKDSSAQRMERINSHQISAPQPSACNNQLSVNNTQEKEQLEKFKKLEALMKWILDKYTEKVADINGFKKQPNLKLRSKL